QANTNRGCSAVRGWNIIQRGTARNIELPGFEASNWIFPDLLQIWHFILMSSRQGSPTRRARTARFLKASQFQKVIGVASSEF
ncbi:MAG: hypothetical protein K8F58_11225, partial [Bauldia sp.]|nr:hypothetical protein [Bauldia sp.]